MKSRFCILILLAVGLATSCYPVIKQNQSIHATSTSAAINEPTADARNYIGIIYPPYPDSIVFQGGTAIYPSRHSFKWGVDRVTDNHYNMLWLNKVVSYDANGIPKNEVSDVIVLPLEEEKRVVAVSTCFLSGVIDPEIVVLAKWDDDVSTTRFLLNKNILLAWRANQTTGKFEELSKQNIECNFE